MKSKLRSMFKRLLNRFYIVIYVNLTVEVKRSLNLRILNTRKKLLKFYNVLSLLKNFVEINKTNFKKI